MTAAAKAPSVWILWRRRHGDLDQMTVLAKALGWPFVVKNLHFFPPDIPAFANLLLKPNSDRLTPPWPDLVICAEAMPSIVARRLREQSQGRTKAVCLARPAGTASAFDLVITTAQYRVPPATNILELSLPLSDGTTAEAGDTVMAPRSVRPRIVLVVGGTSFPERLDGAAAETMVQEVKRHAEALGGAMVCVTSPRTGGDVVHVLRKLADAPHELHLYGKGRVNPYRQLIAEADEIVVTSDSVSMVSDALETGQPVFVYPLPRPKTLEWRLSEWLYRHAVVDKSPLLAPVRLAFDAGVFEPGADRRLLFERLARQGRIAWFGQDAPEPQTGLAARELDDAVERVRALLERRPAA